MPAVAPRQDPLPLAPYHDADRPRKPRPTGGPEGPWWRRPIRPD